MTQYEQLVEKVAAQLRESGVIGSFLSTAASKIGTMAVAHPVAAGLGAAGAATGLAAGAVHIQNKRAQNNVAKGINQSRI